MRKNNTRHVRGIIDSLLQKLEKGAVKRGAVFTAWEAATEEETRAHARPVSLKKGKLMVIVENSPWLYKLTMEKRNILEKFNEHYIGRKKAADIRFRIGDPEV